MASAIYHAQLNVQLTQGTVASLYAIVGEEDLLRDAAVGALKASLLGEGESHFNCDLFYGDDVSTQQAAFGHWFHAERVAGDANVELVKATARSQVEAGWDRVAGHLAARGPYMCGMSVSATDFLATML